VEINVLFDEGVAAEVEPSWLESMARRVLAAEKVADEAELSLVITGQEKIRQLNRDYRSLDEPTDVLAFASGEQAAGAPAFVPPPDGVLHLGEVIISYPQAQLQAAEHGHTVNKELSILLIHGLLHLLGYDHETDAEEAGMQVREKELLSLIEGGG
jgi:probable rRNA maturation factor